MSKRKTFDKGTTVEVQREVGRPWEPAVYDKAANDMSSRSGFHWVTLPEDAPPIYIDSMSGCHYDERDIEGRRYLTRRLLLPSVRVRTARP